LRLISIAVKSKIITLKRRASRKSSGQRSALLPQGLGNDVGDGIIAWKGMKEGRKNEE
jgi:hypothetical protein